MTSMYQSSSANQYKDYTMVPKSPDLSTTFNEATTPAVATIVDKPNYVIVNGPGTFAFAYKSGSLSTYTTGSKIATNAGPQELPIQPVAWRRTDDAAATGDVTFVYVRVR
tara:strand:+ start:738 stop:1067 length:330 start_codon:yes stop_codon:yes gene_type:complete